MSDEERVNNRIQECILNIDMTVRSLYFSIDNLKELKVPRGSQVFNDILQYMYIRICTIIDELEILFPLAKLDPYLQETLYCAQPAIKGIRKYTGLRKARNLMLAHLNRNNKKEFHPWWEELLKFKLPRTLKEINQILTFLNLINGILVSRYYEKFSGFTNSIRPNYERYFENLEEIEKEAANNPTPLDEVEIEVKKRCEEKGLVQFALDPAMIKYWKFGIIKHFKPRPVKEVLNMSDDELKELPEFAIPVSELIESESKKMMRPLTRAELENVVAFILKAFRAELAKIAK